MATNDSKNEASLKINAEVSDAELIALIKRLKDTSTVLKTLATRTNSSTAAFVKFDKALKDVVKVVDRANKRGESLTRIVKDLTKEARLGQTAFGNYSKALYNTNTRTTTLLRNMRSLVRVMEKLQKLAGAGINIRGYGVSSYGSGSGGGTGGTGGGTGGSRRTAAPQTPEDEAAQLRREQERYAERYLAAWRREAAYLRRMNRAQAQAAREYANLRMAGQREQRDIEAIQLRNLRAIHAMANRDNRARIRAERDLARLQRQAALRSQRNVQRFWRDFDNNFRAIQRITTQGARFANSISNFNNNVIQGTIRTTELLWRTGYRTIFVLGSLIRGAGQFINVLTRASRVLWNFGQSIATIATGAIKSAYQGIMQLSMSIGRTLVTYLRQAYTWLTRVSLVLVGLASAVIGKAIQAFASFEQQIKNTGTVLGLLGNQLKYAESWLIKIATTMAQHSSKSAKDIADSFYELASAGLTLREVGPVATASLALAEGAAGDLRETAETLMATMQGMRIPFDQAARVANVFAESIARSPATLHKLTESMRYAAPIAGTFGLSVEETVGALQALFNVGLTGEMAGTGFRQFLLRLTSPVRKTIDILKTYGITMDQVNVSQRGLIPVIRTLAEAQISATDLTRIFQARALTAASAFMAQSHAIGAYVAEVTNTNTAFRLQYQQLQTLQGQWKIFTSIVEAAQITFGEAARSGLMSFVTMLQSLVKTLINTNVLTSLGSSVGKLVGAVAGTLSNTLPVILTVINYLSTSVEQLAGSITKLINAIAKDLVEVISLGGLQEITAIFQNFGQVVLTNLQGIFTLIKSLVQNKVLSTLTTIFSNFYHILVSIGVAVAQNLLTNFDKLVGILTAVTQRIIPIVIRLAQGLINLLQPKNISAFFDVLLTGWEYIAEVAVIASSVFSQLLQSGILKQLIVLLGQIAVAGATLLAKFFDALITRAPAVLSGLRSIATMGLQVFATLLQTILYLANPETIQKFVGLVQQMLGALQRLIVSAASIIQNAFDLINRYLPVAITLFEIIISRIPQVLQSLLDRLPRIVSGILNFIRVIVEAVVTGIAMIMPYVPGIIDTLNKVNDMLNRLLGTFGALKAIVIVVATGLLLPLITSFINFVISIIRGFTALRRGFLSFMTVMRQIFPWLQGGFRAIGGWILRFINFIFGGIGRLIPALSGGLSAALVALGAWLTGICISIGTAIAEAIIAAAAAIGAPVALILAGLAAIGLALWALIANWSTIVAMWEELCASLADFWDDFVDHIINGTKKVRREINGMKNDMNPSARGSVFGVVPSGIQNLSNAVTPSAQDRKRWSDRSERKAERDRARDARKAAADARQEQIAQSQAAWNAWAEDIKRKMATALESITRGFAGDLSSMRSAIVPSTLSLPPLGNMFPLSNNAQGFNPAVMPNYLAPQTAVKAPPRNIVGMPLNITDAQVIQRKIHPNATAAGAVINLSLQVPNAGDVAAAAGRMVERALNAQLNSQRRSEVWQSQ